MRFVEIGNRKIGRNQPTYVVAEAGVNHNGSLDRARDLIAAAAKAGADAIKFQTYKAEKLVTKSAPRFWRWDGEEKQDGTQYDSYSRLDKFPLEAYPDLIESCKDNGIEFLSTPFDEASADALIRFGMKAIKISSSDVTNLPFLRFLARYHVPIILSVGASTLGEIEEAVEAIEREGNRSIVILQCTLVYPTSLDDVNLRTIPTLECLFPEYPIGISDHTLGTLIPPVAVAVGACLVEKHFTVDKTLKQSADHWLSVDPTELREMIGSIRDVERALGTARKFVLESEAETYLYDKRSLVAACEIKAGTSITANMLVCKRPGTGIRPKYFETVVGRTARVDIPEDSTISWDMV
jgi:N,N'-diacetyllegionaminate synthase